VSRVLWLAVGLVAVATASTITASVVLDWWNYASALGWWTLVLLVWPAGLLVASRY
jgi:hypothetical protein